MLRKRNRSVTKEVSDPGSESNIESEFHGSSQKSNSFFNVARLFWGLNPKNTSYSDSAKSPKSPLDEIFSRSPESPLQDGCQKSWNCGKVGLSIVDSLDAEDGGNAFSRERILHSSDSKKVISGPKPRPEPSKSDDNISPSVATKTLSEDFSFLHTHLKSSPRKDSSDVVFEIGVAPPNPYPLEKPHYSSMDSCIVSSHPSQLISVSPKSSSLSFPTMASGDIVVGSLSENDIELSEDYTCVTLHGPNPKTTHIFGDCVLECHSSDGLFSNFVRRVKEDMQKHIEASAASCPCTGFLSSCHACKKPLEEGKDIYIYRGEKAFCSPECRLKDISLDEASEETVKGSGEEGSL